MIYSLFMDSKANKLSQIITSKIFNGDLAFNEKLPSVRKLAKTHNVSTVTANLAMAQLKSNGLVAMKRGSGTYVTYKPDKNAHIKELNIGLAYLDAYSGYMDQSDIIHPALGHWLKGMHDHFSPQHTTIEPLCYHKLDLRGSDSAVKIALERKKIDVLRED